MAGLLGAPKYNVTVKYCDGKKEVYNSVKLGTPSNFLLSLNIEKDNSTTEAVYMPLVNIKRFTIQEVKKDAEG